MPTICRLLQLAPDRARALLAKPDELQQAIASSRVYTDVYRYWDGIQFLLARHRPGTAAARWLELGTAVSAASGDIPASRVLLPDEVAPLAAELRTIEPDDLAPHYDAAELDEAKIYPRSWVEWEETFDPLGQMLEHCSFLQSSARGCAEARNALLLHFEFLDDGSV
jgi:uncharacterized protein DUF1877